MTSVDEKFMNELCDRVNASLFRPTPNPKVGCLIVKNGIEIGFGIHKAAGGPHAEVIAGEMAGENLEGATVYVTLEPCSHFGRTAPCADYLISKKVAKVVFAIEDETNASGGAEKIQAAGIEVVSNVGAVAARRTLAPWLHFQNDKLPFVRLKFAKTKDGYIAKDDGSSKWISGDESRELVHRLRAQSDAVLVGTKTAIVDLPKLDARISGVEVQPQAFVMGESELGRTADHLHHLKTREPLVALQQLAQAGIQSVLLEGGAVIGQAFLDAGLVHEIWVFESQTEFGSGIAAPRLDLAQWKVQKQQRIGGDTLTVYVPA